MQRFLVQLRLVYIIEFKRLSMKLFFSVFVSVVVSFTVCSQDLDSRLLDRYSLEELTKLYKDNLTEYQFLDYALDNAVYLTDIPMGKNVEFESIDISTKELNFVALGLDIKEVNQYFKVLGRNKMLVVKSRYVLNQESN
jgi:hypothetical protein